MSDSPMQTQKVIQEILRNHLKHDLTEADRAALAKASRQLLSHASTGLWIGSTVGAALAFRSRWASAFRNLQKARSANGASASSSLNSVFYPKKGAGLESASKAADAGMSDAAKSGRSVRFILKGLGFGLLGGFVGTQIGVVTGTLAGRKTIQTEGNEERIARAIRKISIELNERVGTNTEGNKDGSFNNGFKNDGSGTMEGGDSDMIVPDENYYGKRMSSGDEFETADPSSSAPRTSTIASQASAWDALRKSNVAPPSSWDSIREENAKANAAPMTPSAERGSSSYSTSDRRTRLDGELPDGSSGRGFRRDGDYMTGEGKGGEGRNKEDERREFEKLMERERGGQDSAGAGRGSWRGPDK